MSESTACSPPTHCHTNKSMKFNFISVNKGSVKDDERDCFVTELNQLLKKKRNENFLKRFRSVRSQSSKDSNESRKTSETFSRRENQSKKSQFKNKIISS